MTTVAQIRAAIVAVIGGVAGIGQVHDYERYAKREADFRALFESGGQIKGWVLRRLSRAAISPSIGRVVVTTRWQIRGYWSLDDAAASEKTFDDLVDVLVAAFAADETLGGVVAATIIDEAAGLQLDDAGPVMFAGVLAHSARLTLNTRHYE